MSVFDKSIENANPEAASKSEIMSAQSRNTIVLLGRVVPAIATFDALAGAAATPDAAKQHDASALPAWLFVTRAPVEARFAPASFRAPAIL